jgi:hypothetical protein
MYYSFCRKILDRLMPEWRTEKYTSMMASLKRESIQFKNYVAIAVQGIPLQV